MPIYEYRCSECGFQKEFLQKVSDPRLTTCTSCGKETFQKMLTAAGFQLKGSGWYATDFKNSGAKPAAKSDDAGKADKPTGDAAKTDAAKSDGKSESGAKSSESSTTAAAPAKSDSAPSTSASSGSAASA